MTTREEIESSHKKAIKALEGEKRAAIKKAKGTKGKKAKDAITKVESEYETKLKELQDKYQNELSKLDGGGSGGDDDGGKEENENTANETTTTKPEQQQQQQQQQTEEEKELSQKEKKQLKARRKKERQKEKELQRQKELEELEQNAGPSLRDVELEQLETILTPINYTMVPVDADGHCLYRAVAAQLQLRQSTPEEQDDNAKSYLDIRSLCADTLSKHQQELEPFVEYTEQITTFQQYVNQVRDSAEWGGHLELRAISIGLQQIIHIYSVPNGSSPVIINPFESNPSSSSNQQQKEPLRLSYHLHYYALGEHYNHIISLS